MKISIITVTYNSANTLYDTINSVLSQTYQNIEYIIVDGNSSDNTVGIIKENQNKFHGKLKWISEPDKGLYDAMNKGIKMANGDIVGIVNSDDFYHNPNIINEIGNCFKDTSIEAVYGDVRFVKPDDLEKTIRYYSSKNFKPSKFRWGYMPAHPTFFTYKKYFDELGYYKTDYKIAADFELLLRFLYKKQLNAKYIPMDFMKMRLGGASTASLKSNWILNKEIIRACKANGIYTCMPMLCLKYFAKIFEFVFTKN